MKNPAAVALGRMGGQARSKAKTKAARRNAKLKRKKAVRITADLQNSDYVVCIGDGKQRRQRRQLDKVGRE